MSGKCARYDDTCDCPACEDDRNKARVIQALDNLERAISALHAHDLHRAIAPEFRDLHTAVLTARTALNR